MSLIISVGVKAQDDKTVTLVASGIGKTQEAAKQNALRSAIEQAFGAFISSKTELLNDQIVSDQISSVANGNIQSYSILNESQLPDGSWGVTLKALISVSKLTSFAEAKGVVIEIKGGLFAFNIKQQLLNEQGEIKAICEMVGLLHEPMQISFDYTIQISEPKSVDAESKNWEIPLIVTATANKNMEFCANYCIKTLAALSLSSEEVSSYKSLNKDVFPVLINYKGVDTKFYLRKQSSINALNTLTNNWEFYTRLFTVQSGMDETYGNGEGTKKMPIADRRGYLDDHLRYIYKFSSRENYNTINFLDSGQQAAIFSWLDARTLNQIEQMNGYQIKPRGVVSQFKHGGFVVYEENGNCLVAATIDQGNEMDWNSAKAACEELILNGYSDWHLPSTKELNALHVNLPQIWLSFPYCYWCADENDVNVAWWQGFEVGDHKNQRNKCNVRAVRVVKTQKNINSEGNINDSVSNYFSLIPTPIGYLNDFEKILTKNEAECIDSLITVINKRKDIAIAVLTISEIMANKNLFDTLTLKIAKEWGMGNKNNGILIVFSKALRKIRIQNGLGIEARLSDDETAAIIDQVIIPEFKKGNYYLGIMKGIQEIELRLN